MIIPRQASKSASVLFLLLILPLCVSGCSTPNLKPFADGAASFSSSIKQTNTAVESKLSSEADANKAAKGILDKYREAATIYNDMAGLSAGYSSALAELGTAGETGGQAARQIVQTVKGFSDFTGLGVPGVSLPLGLSSEIAGRAIQEAAQLWTRLEAHETLLETMKAAEPAVQKLSLALVDVYGRPLKDANGVHWRPFEKIVHELVSAGRDQLKNDLGKGKLAFYRAASNFLQTKYAGAGAALKRNSAGKANQAFDQDVEKLIEKRARIQAEVSLYLEADKALLSWKTQQIATSYLIADAAKAWAAEHQRLVQWFENCGGRRFLKNDCGQFSATTLNALASNIQFILKGE